MADDRAAPRLNPHLPVIPHAWPAKSPAVKEAMLRAGYDPATGRRMQTAADLVRVHIIDPLMEALGPTLLVIERSRRQGKSYASGGVIKDQRIPLIGERAGEYVVRR